MVLARLSLVFSGRHVVVTEDFARARDLCRDLSCHLRTDGGSEILLFPQYDLGPYDELVSDRRSTMNRAGALFRMIMDQRWRFLVISADALLRRVVPRGRFEDACAPVAIGDTIRRDSLIGVLEIGGYNRAPLVEESGTYAVRGGLLDVFPPYLDMPVRIDLFGNEVTSIRWFDPETQSSEDPVEEIWIHPTRTSLLPVDEDEKAMVSRRIRQICDEVNLPTARTDQIIEDCLDGRLFVGSEGFSPAMQEQQGSLLEYLPGDFTVCVDNPPGIDITWNKSLSVFSADLDRRLGRGEPSFGLDRHLVSVEEMKRVIGGSSRTIVSHPIVVSGQYDGFGNGGEESLDLASASTGDIGERLRHLTQAGEKMDLLGPLTGYLGSLTEEGYRVIVTAHTTGQAERLAAMLRGRGLAVTLGEGDESIRRPGVVVSVSEMARGCLLPGDGICWIAEEEIFGRRSRLRSGTRRTGAVLEDLGALEPGDLVVHKEHGIGRYDGLQRQRVRDTDVDFLLIVYREGDKLYLPVYRLDQVQKHRTAGKGSVRLDRLGGQTFFKSKTKMRKQAMEMAARLLDLYARREVADRPAVSAVDDLYREFEASFPFEETPDQERAIDEVMSDLGGTKPMDRLICGDVGFGKTEVALRAAFRVVMSGRQVAVLVPTTVLAQQHYQSFAARFDRYPVRIEMASRFCTDSKNADTILGLKEGKVDVVIGTHRLLSRDVHFKRLGLLVIDEEHRFGVSHKERIRNLRASVDTLVMTATPIPRTLHMALFGMRDLSLMGTAPADRRPIKTVVCHDDPGLLKKAVERELARDGQVFFVHNRVRDIFKVADYVQRLMPDARVAVGHGRMKEESLERVMLDFVAGRYDILVCTSIIESGLDIPRANTIIIDRADTFGLAQLYQIRGRVGRSHVQAYAYLIVPPLSVLGDGARERVEALTRYTDLGSGFSLATLDLEIRGAGNLLGAEQTGDVNMVGFEMFCDMLKEATDLLGGKKPSVEVEPEVTLEEPGFLPEDYIPDVGLRLQFYKRLAAADDEARVEEYAAEMVDRFGALPPAAGALIKGMIAKAMCRSLGIVGLETSRHRLTVHLGRDSRVDPDRVLELIKTGDGALKLTPDLKILVRLDGERDDGTQSAIRFLRSFSSCEI